MSEPLHLRAASPWAAAIEAVHDLLNRLKMDHLFVGTVGEYAWRGNEVASGSIDVLAALTPERKAQIPMMASNRGFIVDRDTVEAAAELDVVPIGWESEGFPIRIHVLVASNALYGRMFQTPVAAKMGQTMLQVPSAEDVVLMMIVGERRAADIESVAAAAGDTFDRARLNEKLKTIGLSGSLI